MNVATQPLALPLRSRLVLKILAVLFIAVCLGLVSIGLGGLFDEQADWSSFAALFAAVFAWLATLQYFAVFRFHPAAAGIIGIAQLSFAVLLGLGLAMGALMVFAAPSPTMEVGEMLFVSIVTSITILLGWCGYLNLKWQARLVLARKDGQITRSDWQFSFRELMLVTTVMAAVLGLAMWQARGRY